MIFTVRQLHQKSREQGKPLYLALFDLTKASDLVTGKGLIQLLENWLDESVRGNVSFEGFT